METVTLRGEDFKTIHNTLCDLRSLAQRMERSMIKVEEVERIIENFEQGLRDAYDQDEDAFDRKMEYYTEFKRENRLDATWSIYELGIGEFFNLHPWQGAGTLAYQGTTARIKGPTWGDLYRASDEVMARSGDDHHIFIEGFDRYSEDKSMLQLTTGS